MMDPLMQASGIIIGPQLHSQKCWNIMLGHLRWLTEASPQKSKKDLALMLLATYNLLVGRVQP